MCKHLAPCLRWLCGISILAAHSAARVPSTEFGHFVLQSNLGLRPGSVFGTRGWDRRCRCTVGESPVPGMGGLVQGYSRDISMFANSLNCCVLLIRLVFVFFVMPERDFRKAACHLFLGEADSVCLRCPSSNVLQTFVPPLLKHPKALALTKHPSTEAFRHSLLNRTNPIVEGSRVSPRFREASRF